MTDSNGAQMAGEHGRTLRAPPRGRPPPDSPLPSPPRPAYIPCRATGGRRRAQFRYADIMSNRQLIRSLRLKHLDTRPWRESLPPIGRDWFAAADDAPAPRTGDGRGVLGNASVLTLLATIRAVRCPGVIGNRWCSRAG
jgi:hypothetical protein